MFKHARVKLFAFFIHIIFSVLIIGIFMLVVTQLWFPDILFSLENVWEGLKILIPVDAILGPILTLILFVPGKKGLKIDLSIIALLQVLALVYGGWIIYHQRPEVIVFNVDRFEIIPASKFDRENLETRHFSSTEIPYPFIVYAVQAQTEAEKNDFSLLFHKMASHYRPLFGYRSVLEEKALQIHTFTPKNEFSKQILKDFSAQYKADEVLLFILEGTTMEANVIILDKSSLNILGYLKLDPWVEYDAP